jgi:hypothetical protein
MRLGTEAAPAPFTHVAQVAIPLAFEPNVGQTDPRVAYLAHGNHYAVFLSASGATLELAPSAHRSGAVLRMSQVRGNPAAASSASGLQRGTSNYLLGRDSRTWHTGVPHYGRVTFRQIYPGIDVQYYGSQTGLEYDYLVAPGASPTAIWMQFAGMTGMSLNGHGDLTIRIPGGIITQPAPVVYQQHGTARALVPARYVLDGHGQVGISVGAYDRSHMLVIDPTLSYSTYLGGTTFLSAAQAAAVDSSGKIYVTGQTLDTDFPVTTGALLTTQPDVNGSAFVAKIDPIASGAASLVYSTYLGGTGSAPSTSTPSTGGDIGYGIAVDAAGNAYVTGSTYSADFPGTSTSPIQSTNNDFVNFGSNAFVAELNSTGSALVYATYLGGSDINGAGDTAFGIALDSANNAYVTGEAFSPDFPTTDGSSNAATGTLGSNTFVAKINAGGGALGYSTVFGGSVTDNGRGIAVDSSGNAYVTGQTYDSNFPTTAGAFQTTNRAFANNSSNAFVTKLSGTGTRLYSTYLGGTDANANGDAGLGIAVDVVGNAYVTGQASSADFPVAAAFQGQNKSAAVGGTNAFVSKLNTTGSALMYSTYLGGTDPNGDAGLAIAVDGLGAAYVTGLANSANFPVTTANAVQITHASLPAAASATRTNAVTLKKLAVRASRFHGRVRPFGIPSNSSDAFVTKVAPSGSSLVWSTFLGGSFLDAGQGIAVDALGNADVAGYTISVDFPVTGNAFQTSNDEPLSAAFVSQLAVSYCQAAVTLTRGVNRLGLAYNVGAPTAMHNIEYITLQVGANTLVARVPLTATCNVGKGPAVFTFTGTVSSARGVVSQGDVVTVTLTVYPPGGPAPVASVTVTRGGVTVLGPVTITGGFGSVVNVDTF